ncbi:MAG: D-2-hydroxyacid dehydrogenase [Cellulosilyticaceae bacterium]
MNKNILVLIPVNESHKNYLESKAPDAKFSYSRPDSVVKEQIEEAHIIIGNPPLRLLHQPENLEWLQLQSAGADTYAKEEVIGKKVLLTNSTGAYGLAVAEHMIGLVFMLYKNLHRYRDEQKRENWFHLGEVKSIEGARVLVIGAGDIGGEFAKRMKALGADTVGVRRTQVAKPEWLDEVYLMEQLDQLLPQADIIALSLPQTKETYKLINQEKLALMKRDAIVINVGRGSSIDTEALCEALEKKQLLGAGLDVTDPEPLPKTHPLWQMENVVITPHVSGGYSLPETLNRIVKIAGENLSAYQNGEPLKNNVDFETGYRKI